MFLYEDRSTKLVSIFFIGGLGCQQSDLKVSVATPLFLTFLRLWFARFPASLSRLGDT